MSAELSRRLGRVANLSPIVDLPLGEREDLTQLTFLAVSLADLPERYQQAILAAEAARERLIAEQRASASA